ncbi:hypothetical protein SAMN05216311_12261 [Chitinophaga sp. CF418]|nr:hypothetical protein SAMN05216311_12261 [Chitinophaga sp. CF418]
MVWKRSFIQLLFQTIKIHVAFIVIRLYGFIAQQKYPYFYAVSSAVLRLFNSL